MAFSLVKHVAVRNQLTSVCGAVYGARSSARSICSVWFACCLATLGLLAPVATPVVGQELKVGFDAADITPEVTADRPVWIAGYGWGRRATGVHDPLYARTLVLSDGDRKMAWVSVDLVGVQLPTVQQIRAELPGWDYVVVSSTHNHEGPDTIGIWGKTPFRRGVDERYMQKVVQAVVQSVLKAEQSLQPAAAQYGTASDETLLGDSRKPVVKDAVLRVLRFTAPGDSKPIGLLVQWNCHPEALGPRNTLITADFCATTVARLEQKYNCPVVYFTGAVGGLMAPPDGLFHDEDGRVLKEGEYEYAEAYGDAVATLAGKAVDASQPIQLTPLAASVLPIAIPVDNSLYRAARLLGVVKRQGLVWTGDFRRVDQPLTRYRGNQFAVRTEVACLRLGQLHVACIPGELYPELVYGQFEDPPQPEVDFPDAPLEPTISSLLPSDRWLLFGLANDEIGYIIPRRQWDRQPPFAYGRNKPQYGEINSCGDEVAPIIMQAFQEAVAGLPE
jgi:hypothetical protein